MDNKIIANSVLVVKATASLSKEIAKELSDNKQDKDLKEIIDENKCTTGNDGRRSN